MTIIITAEKAQLLGKILMDFNHFCGQNFVFYKENVSMKKFLSGETESRCLDFTERLAKAIKEPYWKVSQWLSENHSKICTYKNQYGETKVLHTLPGNWVMSSADGQHDFAAQDELIHHYFTVNLPHIVEEACV